jgi:diguanylate cyclase (GGDEF)-like protein
LSRLPSSSGWSTQQLTEFLAAVGSLSDETAVQLRAVERIAQAVEAEMALLTIRDVPVASVGFGVTTPERRLWQRISAAGNQVEVAGLGLCQRWTVELEEDMQGTIHLIRAGSDPFSSEERGLIRGMARILSMQLRSIRLVDAERGARQESERRAGDIRERQRLLEALIVVQRMITDRVPLQEILDAITADVGRMTGDGTVALRLLEPDDPCRTRIISWVGIEPALLERTTVGQVGAGAAGLAISQDSLVVLEDYPNRSHANPVILEQGIEAAMAAPLREEGRVCGSLVVASNVPGRTYSQTERDTLLAFAEHASLAITDAARTRTMVHSALHDSLTGLPNRVAFLERLNQRLLSGRRGSRPPAALLFIDLDQLKRINDSLGHLAGDELLTVIAGRLRHSVRPADLVARLAGDEFIVLLDEVADVAAASVVADRLLAAMSEPVEVDHRRMTVTGSLGIRMVTSAEGDALEAMRGADLAMYEAKGLGGSRWSVYRKELADRAQRRFTLEGDLRAALDEDGFHLAYQPVVDLATGQVVAAETLLRWRHATRGLIPPKTFIPMAEETGLIVPMGERVLAMAARDALTWDAVSAQPLQLNVNLSVRQLNSPGFTSTLERILSSAGLPPGRLTLEITESVLVEETDRLLQPLRDLRDLGVRLSMDDFGTGYSSLSYLQRLPIDSVKIDRSFVQRVADGPREAAFVRAIVEMCRTLGLTTVAEGVETEQQVNVLRRLRCDLAQGYWFRRPKPASAFLSFLQAAQRDPAEAPSTPFGISPARGSVVGRGRSASRVPFDARQAAHSSR